MESIAGGGRNRWWLVAPALFAGLLLAGCTSTEPGQAQPPASSAGGSAGVPAAWYEALDERFADAEKDGPVGEVPTIVMDAECDLTDSVGIAGEPTERQSGSGVRTLGASGHSLVCTFSGPSVDLSINRFSDASELPAVDAGRRATTESGNEQIEQEIVLGSRTFVVVRKSFPTNDSHIDYGVTYLDTAGMGLVRLDVETTDDRGLIDSYTAQQAAQDLAALLDS
jgi:hypothetical protein